jgi:hypothetical protein
VYSKQVSGLGCVRRGRTEISAIVLTRDAQTLRPRALPFPRAVTVTKVWTTPKTGPT